MLAGLDRLFRRRHVASLPDTEASDIATTAATPPSLSLVLACADDIPRFIEAARHAASYGHAPWVLREQRHIDTLERAVAFTVHRGRWLQRTDDGVEHWQGKLLALRHGDAPPLGLMLACRPDDEAAWQVRFFCIETAWQGHGHGVRLLQAARQTLSGAPLHARLPLACHAATKSLTAAGFEQRHVDALEIASFEAPAQWD